VTRPGQGRSTIQSSSIFPALRAEKKKLTFSRSTI
jgi:hypothetical protein